MSKQRILLVAITLTLAPLMAVPTGQAQEFYKGRSLKIIVAHEPGGGFDILTRLIARHLPKHIPGSPSIVVQNMPGAGGLIGANYIYRIAPRDGTAVGNFIPLQVVRQVIGAPGAEFEAEKFNWLVASHVSDVIACIASTASGVKTLDGAMKRNPPLIVAATGPGSQTLTWPRAYNETLGANFKIVTGYRGTVGVRAAIERGEADAGCWSWSSIKVTAQSMLESGAAVVFTQSGIQGAKDLPQVGNALDRAATKTDRLVLRALLTELSIGRPYMTPPGVPADRVQLLRKAFLDALRDPALIEEANKTGLEVDPRPGEETQTMVAELQKLPGEVKEKLGSIIMEKR